MPDTWEHWVGQVVHEQFPLLRYLGGSEHSAVFLTDYRDGERVRQAVIKLIPSIPSTPRILEIEERHLSGWQLAADLSHPHLIRVFAMGRCELGGVPLLYVVMERAEEDLSQILSDRALTPAETHAMLEPTLDVLAYLHGQGIVHGHMKPANIMAIGDRLMLSSDGLRRTGEPGQIPGRSDAYAPPENARRVIPVAEPISPEEDIWSLGVALAEVLTQKLPIPQSAGPGTPELPPGLPEPFLDIVRHCLVWPPQNRWTVAEIAACLRGHSVVDAKHEESQPASQRAIRAESQPKTEPKTPPKTQPQMSDQRRHRYSVSIAIGFLLVLILAGSRLFHFHSKSPQTTALSLEQPIVPSAGEQATATLPAAAPDLAPNAATRTRESGAAPQPLESVAPETPREDNSKTPSAPVQGEVVHQVLPEISQSARDTIRGTVKVSVRVDVGPTGSVENAELESPGPSKYFADRALQAARRWQFAAPKNGPSTAGKWILQFEFTRAEITVVPRPENP